MPTLRRFKTRILVGSDPDYVEILSDVPVRIQEQLEQAVTSVAEFGVTLENWTLERNVPVVIDHINQGVVTEDGYEMKRLYTGVTNSIAGVSYPNKVAVTCAGVLSKLRFSRQDDLVLTGMTDQEAVQTILTFCGIPFTSGDIKGRSYELGAIKAVFWKKGQSAAEIVQELDRVCGYATIEIGNGRVVRIPYSRVPYDYTSDSITKSFRRGQAGSTFYENERDRGGVDQVQNYWRVTGLSWDGEEDEPDEGCHYTIWAEAYAIHPNLGEGVWIAGDFSSDFIQSEALAKEIASRMCRWYNREPDTIRVRTSNDGTLNVGDVIGVTDSVYGIDLPNAKRYLILNIARDGDFMTVDGVGGTEGDVDTLTSGIELCCGHQQEDGTCDEEGDNPSPDESPTPNIPPDSPTGHCDPIADPTCIPGEDYELPEAPNVEDQFIGCETQGIDNPDSDSGVHMGAGTFDCTTPGWYPRCYAPRG